MEEKDIKKVIDSSLFTIGKIVAKKRNKAKQVGHIIWVILIIIGIFSFVFGKWYIFPISIVLAFAIGSIYSFYTTIRIRKETSLNIYEQENALNVYKSIKNRNNNKNKD